MGNRYTGNDWCCGWSEDDLMIKVEREEKRCAEFFALLECFMRALEGKRTVHMR